MRRFVAVLWLGVCIGLLLVWFDCTARIYWSQPDDGWFSQWLWYHMIDLRWRAVALAALAAAPAGVLWRKR